MMTAQESWTLNPGCSTDWISNIQPDHNSRAREMLFILKAVMR